MARADSTPFNSSVGLSIRRGDPNRLLYTGGVDQQLSANGVSFGPGFIALELEYSQP